MRPTPRNTSTSCFPPSASAKGKDNQNIASSLQLALGTVKAHVHNILKKTGTTTRQELAQLFWKG